MVDKKLSSTSLAFQKLSIAVKNVFASDKDLLENPNLSDIMAALQDQPKLRKELINELNKNGNALLHRAVLEDRLDFAAQLLEWGARVNVRNSSDSTALHLAAARGKTDAVAFLQTHGADLKALDENKLTPLYYAVYGNHRDVVSQFIGFGAMDSFAMRLAEEKNHAISDLFKGQSAVVDQPDNRYRNK